MLTLAQIPGQQRAVSQLRRAIAAGRVPHAYLFCGPAGSGKYKTGLALAAALNCLDAPGQGCHGCTPCSKIAAGIHPDVQTLERQGAARIIPIATIRSQVIPQMGLSPHEGKARVFLVEEAAALPDASANALLKTLEEPPARTHFVLATTSPDQLLPTIRSRCQRVNFVALPPELRARLAPGEDDDESAALVAELAETLARAAQASDSGSVHQAASAVAGHKDELTAVLDTLAEKLHSEARVAVADDRLSDAARLSRQAMVVLDTHAAVSQMAHGLMAIEAMIHTMRAALT